MGRLVTASGAQLVSSSGARFGAPDPFTGTIEVTPTFKAISTTVSTTAGNNVVTVGSSTGLNVGDQIVIEDDWVRGTMGVGGIWPPLSYATVSAMNADTTKPTDTYAWVEATGDVYRWNQAWAPNTWWQPVAYYYRQAVPYSLITTITDISGTSVTLAAAPQATKSGLTLYYDNAVPLQNAAAGITSGRIIIPAGTWYASNGFNIESKADIVVTGGGLTSILASIRGTPGIAFSAGYSDRFEVSNLRIIGNCEDTGWGFTRTSTWATSNPYMPITMTAIYSHGVKFQDLRIDHPFQQACNIAYGYNGLIDNVSVYRDQGYQMYTQWMLTLNDSTYGTIQNCLVDCNELVTAIELFRTDHCNVLNNTTRNGVYSLNANGTFLHSGNSVTLEADTRGNTHFTKTMGISVSKNVSPPASTFASGGTIEDFTMIVEGPVYGDGSDDFANPSGIVIDTPCENVAMDNIYVEYAPGTLCRAVNSNAPGTSLANSQIYGDDAGTYHTENGANVYLRYGTVSNTTARTTPTSGVGGSIDAEIDGGGNVAQYQTYG